MRVLTVELIFCDHFYLASVGKIGKRVKGLNWEGQNADAWPIGVIIEDLFTKLWPARNA